MDVFEVAYLQTSLLSATIAGLIANQDIHENRVESFVKKWGVAGSVPSCWHIYHVLSALS